jgi:flagellar motor switch/type III secretory pathway protein FliN
MMQDEKLPPENASSDDTAPADTEMSSLSVRAPAPDFMSAGDMLVMLEFHLPGRKVPLSEVANWTQGGLVALPEATLGPSVPITVRNGDRVIAEGHLVRLDDCFGVRIDRTYVRR